MDVKVSHIKSLKLLNNRQKDTIDVSNCQVTCKTATNKLGDSLQDRWASNGTSRDFKRLFKTSEVLFRL